MVDPAGRRLRLRAELVAAALFAIFAALGGRLYTRQVARAEHWTGLALKQQRPIREVMAYRGDIRSADGVVLARSVRARSAFAEPRFMGARGGRERPSAEDLAAAAHAISVALGYAPEQERDLLGRFTGAGGEPRGFVWIERRLDRKRAERLKEAAVRGVSFKEEYRREYPNGSLAAHLLGLVRLDAEGDLEGLSGVEKVFDRELAGIDGLREVVRDAKGGSILDEGSLSVAPEDGATVTLTIDSTIQRYAERAIAKGGEEWTPEGISVTVLSPKDGRILAIASWPTYDPNTLVGLTPRNLRFRPLMDTFEPGSILKPLIVAAALDGGAVTATSIFDCTSPRRVGSRTVVDKHPKNGPRTLREILAYSLNCGMVQVADRLGPRGLSEALLRSGFGQPTGLGLPLEERGRVPPLSRWLARWGYHSTVSVAQGYELMVNQVQMASAFAALGRGGLRMRPRVLERVEDARGLVVRRCAPEVAARVAGAPILDGVIIPALGDVVEFGTARRSKLDRWRMGGKTGTAKKLTGRGYDARRNVSSFIALAPLEDPALLVAVTVDDPRSKGGDPSGGIVAAPIAREVLAEALPYLRVPPSPSPATSAREE